MNIIEKLNTIEKDLIEIKKQLKTITEENSFFQNDAVFKNISKYFEGWIDLDIIKAILEDKENTDFYFAYSDLIVIYNTERELHQEIETELMQFSLIEELLKTL